MKDKHTKYPQLRFKGFTDPWEQRKLSEIYDKIRNAFVGTATPYYVNQGHFYLESNNVKYGKLNFNNEVYINDDFYQKQKPNWLHTGDLVVVQSGHVGHSAVIPSELNNTAAHAVIIVAKPKQKIDPYFINDYLQTNIARKQIDNITTGNTIKHILASAMKMFEVSLPSYEEQRPISNLLAQIDDTITLHQRKLAKLKELKQGYLQKLFPKNGSKFPQLRFAGFADAWEERKLGELSNIVGGGTPSTSNPEYWDGDIDWYAPAEIGEQSYVSKSKKTITELGLKKSSARILPVGTVLFTSRAGIGNTAILAKEATTNQGFQSIVPDQNKLDSYFIFSRTNELKRYGEVTGAGSTFVEVSGKQMSKMSIMVPELSEQQKIGSFFKQLDDTIALHQRKLEKLQELKKGYLQKMFC
ncbi:restriction endonuclease subunit S [Secundilactobacillus paracollinoides]|uniref:restriction endonuclease subunit S n=1 Tax=Secundilactobacillus paracollinoides TaxID=240427 RepID=UPI0009F5C550|nr:restriction endonuclease subunit S [Secundilactobacillus paracollinoides]